MNDMMQIQGEWMNKNTGQKIQVRNSIIDGDQMIIITNMGQISMEEFSRNYIQASDEVYDDEGNVIATEKMASQPSEQSNIKIETINDQEYFIDDKPVIVQFDYNVEFTATEKYQRPFTDDMKAGIKKIKVVASTEYDYPTVSIVKNIYRQFTSEVIPNEGE